MSNMIIRPANTDNIPFSTGTVVEIFKSASGRYYGFISPDDRKQFQRSIFFWLEDASSLSEGMGGHIDFPWSFDDAWSNAPSMEVGDRVIFEAGFEQKYGRHRAFHISYIGYYCHAKKIIDDRGQNPCDRKLRVVGFPPTGGSFVAWQGTLSDFMWLYRSDELPEFIQNHAKFNFQELRVEGWMPGSPCFKTYTTPWCPRLSESDSAA